MTAPKDQTAETWHRVKSLLEALSERAPRCIPVLVAQARYLLDEGRPDSLAADGQLRQDAERWRRIKPLLDTLASIHPSSMRATAIGTDEQVADAADAIVFFLNGSKA